MSDKRWKALTVPYEVVAADTTESHCYRLSGKTVQMLLAMIEYMEWRTRWHKADGLPLTESEIDNVKAWAAQGAYELMTPEPCADESCEDGDCVAYYPTNPLFTYAPNDPFSTCGTPPAGYITCPLVSGLASGIPGALPDDIYCTIPTLLPAPPLALIDQILNSGFPRVHFEFDGSGEIEVHLLEVAQGGLAIVRVDDVAFVNVVNLQGISLASIAPSLDFVISVVTGLLDWSFVNEKIIEFSVPDGSHTLDILFIPNLSFNILETGWGGGLRSVVLCGDFTVVSCPETIIDPIFGGGGMPGLFDMCWEDTEDGPILKYTLNGGCTWNSVLKCDGTVPGTDGGEPQIPTIDPIDQPGTYPQPDLVLGNRCRVVNATFFNLFNLALTFFSSVLALETATERANALRIFLDATDEDGSGLQWYTPFSLFIQKYLPFIANIGNSASTSTWEDVLECIVLGCYPVLTDVTRDILECIADGLDSEAGALAPTDDRVAYYKYIADFFRIYPLSQIRANAFRDAINTEVSSVCTDCGGGGGGCENAFVTFEPSSFPFTIQTGSEGIGKNGLGVKSIDLPANTYSTLAGAVKDNGLRVIIPLPEPCLVKGIFWQFKLKIGNPTPNANVSITPGIMIRTYSLDALTSVQEPAIKKYYYYWATEWSRIGFLYPEAVWTDRVEITMYFGTKYSTRLIESVIDEVEIIMD